MTTIKMVSELRKAGVRREEIAYFTGASVRAVQTWEKGGKPMTHFRLKLVELHKDKIRKFEVNPTSPISVHALPKD